MTQAAISLSGVHVTYPIRGRGAATGVRALQDLSLLVSPGERVGLIGVNGSGKTTLLRVMSRILVPQQGAVEIVGTVCPLFEFTTGFEMEANGWENIKTRALLLGMPHPAIEERIGQIAAFTGLGDFLDFPVKTYSSGMLLRLAFATSTAVEPDVLLLDEVMAAGDISFVEKAQERMNAMVDRAQVVVFATHAVDSLPDSYPRTVWLHRGRIEMDGPSSEVVSAYKRSASSSELIG